MGRGAQASSAQDVIALDTPGFSFPILDGFGCTANEYATWLLTQMERIRREHGSVDLVGHDWGCLLVARVTSLRPDLLRSWAAGGGRACISLHSTIGRLA